MANSLASNPYVFDTAGATSAVPIAVSLHAIIYSGNTGGDVVSLRDSSAGNILFELTDNTAPVTITFSPPVPVDGLYVETLTAGTLIVYAF